MPPLSWMPGAVLHFLRIYPYFFDIYLCVFSENSVVGCSPGGCRRTPRCTPLRGTVIKCKCYYRNALFLSIQLYFDQHHFHPKKIYLLRIFSIDTAFIFIE